MGAEAGHPQQQPPSSLRPGREAAAAAAPPAVLGLQLSALIDHVARVDWSLLDRVPGDRGGSQQIDNESSCSSPADGTPRSPADDTRTSPDEESPCSHSSTCRRSSSILCRLDSGQQPHPRNMDDSKDAELLRILGYARMHQKQINSRWYQEDAVLERISKTSTINSLFPGIDLAMLKQRIQEFEKMVIDYYEGKLTTMPNQDLMLHVFSNIMHDSKQIPETPLNSGKRATLVSEELEAPSTKRARSESVNMAMYLSNPDAASKLLKGGLGMDDCTTRAEYLLHDSHMLYPAITLLRQNIEIRQSFMTFGDSHARGYIEYELKQHGML